MVFWMHLIECNLFFLFSGCWYFQHIYLCYNVVFAFLPLTLSLTTQTFNLLISRNAREFISIQMNYDRFDYRWDEVGSSRAKDFCYLILIPYQLPSSLISRRNKIQLSRILATTLHTKNIQLHFVMTFPNRIKRKYSPYRPQLRIFPLAIS